MRVGLISYAMHGKCAFYVLTLWTFSLTSPGEDIVRLGAGSYATKAPAGAKLPPPTIFRTGNVKGPMPTNDWWSSLAWTSLSDVMYPHPLAVRAVPEGVRVYYPGANITANESAIFASMPAGSDDFIIGHSKAARFAEARVDGFSDWFVTALFEDGTNRLRASFGHGSPFVFVTVEGGSPSLAFGKEPPKVWAGNSDQAILGITVKDRHYGLFAPSGSKWSDIGSSKWTVEAHGHNYFTVAVLPDDQPETLALFARHAYNHVTDTRVSWSFDEARSRVATRFDFSVRKYEGNSEGTLTALYPHQWTRGTAEFTGHSYNSVRGRMKLAKGLSFSTAAVYPGVLPALPLTANAEKARLDEMLEQALAEKGKLVADTYWMGKQLGKWATLIPIAEQVGNKTASDNFSERLRASLENFFTATDRQGILKASGDGVFAYDANWGTLIGYPASYDSDTQLNDHHFHYGYFIRAAGELARRNPTWASDPRWGGMVKLLIRDIANPDREDKLFPFLRCFDPYAGHSWASGHAKFADGNNNESSSEAINAWFGVILFAQAIGDKSLRDMGVWLLTTEIEAINHYWFDVTGEFHHPNFPASVVTMVWGGKGANGTWFSSDPELVHGINWLPFTGASLYLGAYPEYSAKNYLALVAEREKTDAKNAARPDKPLARKRVGRWAQWADIIWMYRALTDPRDALTQFDARPSDFQPEGGNSLANIYSWLTTLDAFGEVDRTVTADAPFYAVFRKGDRRTHVAYNMASQSRTVKFSDGLSLVCPAGAFGIR